MASILNATTSSGLVTSADNSGSLQLATNNGTTAVTIDTSQNVGIGTSPIVRLDVANSSTSGTGIVTTGRLHHPGTAFADGPRLLFTAGSSTTGGCAIAGYGTALNAAEMVFYAGGNTERMRITSGGDVLMGTTTASLTSGQGFKFFNNSGSNPYVGAVMESSNNAQTNYHLYSTTGGAYRFYVGAGGTISATSATITSLSDVRLKENIQDIDVGLDALMALRPRKFDWKEGKGKDKKGDRGWIAQEFETVFPDMIDEWKDEPPEGEEPYKSVNADLIPILVKAIQELKAELDATKAEVQALKGTL